MKPVSIGILMSRACIFAVALSTTISTTVWSSDDPAIDPQYSVAMHGAVNAMGERCHLFKRSGLVSFSYSSRYPVDFNIHHHGDTHTQFPVKLSETAVYQGEFTAEPNHEYCFMWQNRTLVEDRWVVKLDFEFAPIENASR